MTARPQFPVGVTPISYAWRSGFPHKSVNPNIVGKEFERIEQQHGKVTPQIVVDASRDSSSPLHPLIEWDNTVAGALWREDQAGQLISAIYVINVRNDTEEELPPIRAFVRITEAPAGNEELTEPKHFTSIAKVMSDQDLRDAYERQAFKAFVSLRERYQDIERLVNIFNEIDRLRQELDS
jgi:hypothetical protein